MKALQGFKQFVLRGNVVDLAIGVVMGVAFQSVVSSLVKDVLTPMLGVFGTPDFGELAVTVGRAQVRYGLFLNAILSFVIMGFALYFFVVKPVNRLMGLRKTEPEVDSVTRKCPYCLSAIPSEASRCAFCTQSVDPVPEQEVSD